MTDKEFRYYVRIFCLFLVYPLVPFVVAITFIFEWFMQDSLPDDHDKYELTKTTASMLKLWGKDNVIEGLKLQ